MFEFHEGAEDKDSQYPVVVVSVGPLVDDSSKVSSVLYRGGRLLTLRTEALLKRLRKDEALAVVDKVGTTGAEMS